MSNVHYFAKPEGCPFDFKAARPAKSFVVHGMDNWRVSLNGHKSTSTLYKVIALVNWDYVQVDDYKAGKNETYKLLFDNPEFKKNCDYHYLDIEKIKSIEVDDNKNILIVKTNN